MMKKWGWIVILGGILLLGSSPVVGAPKVVGLETANKVQVIVNENCEANQCAEGYLQGGSVYVPIRFVMETIGGQIRWDAQNKVVHVESNPFNPTRSTEDEDEDEVIKPETDVKMNWRETGITLRKLDSAMDQLNIFNDLVDAAYDMYETTGEVNWVEQVSSGKVKELKNAMTELNQELLAYHDKHAANHKRPEIYPQLAKKVVDAASFYEMSTEALNRYVDNNNSNEKKTFLLYRFFALEQVTSISKELLELQVEYEEQK